MTSCVCRTEVLEYGYIPISPWLSHLNSLTSLQSLLRDLVRQGEPDQNGRCFVTLEVIADALDANAQQTLVLLDLLAAVIDDENAMRLADNDAPIAVDAYRLVLFLLVHYYSREAARADTADVWPSDHPSAHQAEPSSPMRLTRAWSKEQQPHHAHLPSTRQKMQEHLFYQEAIFTGFGVFLGRHAADLVALISGDTPAEGVSEPDDLGIELQEETPQATGLGPAQVNRLGFLLSTDGGALGTRDQSVEEGGSPMDVCLRVFPSPFAPSRPSMRLSEALSHLWDLDGTISPTTLTSWIKESLDREAEGGDGDASMISMALSPPRISMFNQLAPPTLSMIGLQDVYAMNKATAVRGESDLQTGSVRVIDCHDAVVYCLAPLKYAKITCCTDCVVVLGAVGRTVRVERCERVQIIAAAKSVVINTCHDCILYLGVNRPPMLLGDNRFVQLAPHNAAYERLAEHMALAGVAAEPNVWASSVQLLPDHTKHHHAPLHGSPGSSGGLGILGGLGVGGCLGGEPVAEHPCATLLPPEKLMPFLVPFRGGPGPLCGGAAQAQRESSLGEDTITGLLTQGDVGIAAFARSPFPLPPEFAAAWEMKMAGVAGVRAAYREADLDEEKKREFMAAIQSHFKEWLQAGGGMREVYDLARVEKERRKEGAGKGV